MLTKDLASLHVFHVIPMALALSSDSVQGHRGDPTSYCTIAKWQWWDQTSGLPTTLWKMESLLGLPVIFLLSTLNLASFISLSQSWQPWGKDHHTNPHSRVWSGMSTTHIPWLRKEKSEFPKGIWGILVKEEERGE